MAEYADDDRMSTGAWDDRPTRRGFLAGALAAAVAASSGRAWAAAAGEAAEAPVEGARVVRIASSRVIEGLEVRRRRLRKMIDACICRLSGRKSPAEAWPTFAPAGARVLLKFARMPGWGLRTEPAMLRALVDSLSAAGYDRANLVVAGCPQARFVEGLAAAPPGWSARTIAVAGGAEQIRKYLDGIDVIINVPTLSDHNLVGVSCAMMNVSLPLIRRPGRFYHDRLGEAIVSIAGGGGVIPTPSLTLVNALRGVYDGGPAVDENRVAYDESVWGATDMVAVDRLAAQWIERHRKIHKLPSLTAAGRAPAYIDLAGRRGLGAADLRRIVAETHLL